MLLKSRASVVKKKKGCIEMLPRFKIQYPMKNRGETNLQKHNLQVLYKKMRRMWKVLTSTGFYYRSTVSVIFYFANANRDRLPFIMMLSFFFKKRRE